MFTNSATYYDAIYVAMGKDYNYEAELLHTFVQDRKKSFGKALLDVGCGTGGHIGSLREHYMVTGLDLDLSILEVARQKYPDVAFVQADMANFTLGQSFDVITCLFSSIGYVKTIERLHKAVSAMNEHLTSGGVILIEPWFAPSDMTNGFIHAVFVDQPKLKIARMSTTLIDGRISTLDFHYLIATPGQVRHTTEQHELGLFTHQEYLAALGAAGLEVTFYSKGLDGRGLYIGFKA